MDSYVLEKLKEELLAKKALVTPEQVASTPGCSTGWAPLDGFLIWQGFPKGALSLLTGEPGLGATRLWLQSAAKLTKEGKWVAWMNGEETQINGGGLKNMDHSRMLWVSGAASVEQRLWALQELASLCLFDLIGCDLEKNYLRGGQLLKLKKLAMRYQVAVVLVSSKQRSHPFFSFVLEFNKNNIVVARALHRPTPHQLERRELYADTLPQLATGRAALCG